MKTIACIALCASFFVACKSDRKGPLVGKWKLTSISTTPTATGPKEPPVGTIYTFSADSSLSVSTVPANQRYSLEKLPEGMFLLVGDSPKVRYRVVAMTPGELGLQQDRGESLLNLKLEFQP